MSSSKQLLKKQRRLQSHRKTRGKHPTLRWHDGEDF